MNVKLFSRKSTSFVLWAPRQRTPKLVIGTFLPGAPPTLTGKQTFNLIPVVGLSDLFEIAAGACGLSNGTVYHYKFEVDDTNAGHGTGARILVCDPAAFTTDWRLTEGDQPASVVKFDNGKLVPCDPDGTVIGSAGAPNVSNLPKNNHMVIYELPTAWTRRPHGGGVERGVGTFRDIVAMVDKTAQGANFGLKPKQATEAQKLIEEHLNEIRIAWAKHFPSGSH